MRTSLCRLSFVLCLLALPFPLFALSTGYTQLDKLEFNGQQWIETGYCPTASDRFECDVSVADVQSNATAAVFGTVPELKPERAFAFYVRQGGDDTTVVAYGNTARGRFFPRDKKVTLSVGPDGATWEWDGGSDRLALTPGSARDGVTPLMIGDVNAARFEGDSVPGGTGAAMTLRGFRVWYGGLELIHDYVPCRNSSGEIGLYDTLEKDAKARFKRLEPQSFWWRVPYRAWDPAQMKMVDCVCTNAIPVMADTATFADGQWYAVTGTVSRGKITVSGSAHLILCDGATLTANGGQYEPGIEVRGENSLRIYGQAAGTGTLAANGGKGGSGIGGGDGGGPAGTVTIDGGTVTAIGGEEGAGIGGGYEDAGGTVTINGGMVTATGGDYGAGIGGGWQGVGATVTINGGTVTATGRDDAEDIGKGHNGQSDGTLTIDGGSIKVARVSKDLAKNSSSNNVHCVTVKCSGMSETGRGLRLEGLDGYGTNDIYAVEGCVYLWLPNGAHLFSVSDGEKTNRYCAVVNGRDVTAERLGPVGFFANGTDVGDAGVGDGWIYFGRVLSLTNAMEYVLSGVATNGEVQVRATAAGAKVVLSNMVVFASNRAAFDTGPGVSLTVAANQVMKTGDTPKGLRYAKTYNGEPCVLAAPGVPVTPGVPCGSYATAEAATNALAGAFVDPADPVAKVLTSEALLEAYRDMFAIGVTGGESSWSLEAVLTPTARTNLSETATGATRQIPVAAIARLSEVSATAQQPEIGTLTVTTNVTVRGCAPGFYYSLYDGWALTNIVADANATNLNVLCGADAKLVFPEVKKPLGKMGFFRVGVGVTDNVGKR